MKGVCFPLTSNESLCKRYAIVDQLKKLAKEVECTDKKSPLCLTKKKEEEKTDDPKCYCGSAPGFHHHVMMDGQLAKSVKSESEGTFTAVGKRWCPPCMYITPMMDPIHNCYRADAARVREPLVIIPRNGLPPEEKASTVDFRKVAPQDKGVCCPKGKCGPGCRIPPQETVKSISQGNTAAVYRMNASQDMMKGAAQGQNPDSPMTAPQEMSKGNPQRQNLGVCRVNAPKEKDISQVQNPGYNRLNAPQEAVKGVAQGNCETDLRRNAPQEILENRPQMNTSIQNDAFGGQSCPHEHPTPTKRHFYCPERDPNHVHWSPEHTTQCRYPNTCVASCFQHPTVNDWIYQHPKYKCYLQNVNDKPFKKGF